MNQSITALVVDDHPLFAQATRHLLQGMEGIEVVGIAATGRQCLEMVEKLSPDVVFLDYQLPDLFGTQVTERIKSAFPHIHVVIFTGIDVSNLYNELLGMRVSGIISKESSPKTIRNLINCLMDGHSMLPIPVFQQLRMTKETGFTDDSDLTNEEVRIMSLIIDGWTHDRIAELIHTSKRSVDNYLKKIYEKLGVGTKVQAIEKFVQSRYYK